MALADHALVAGIQHPDSSTSTPEAAAATGDYSPSFAPPPQAAFLPYAQSNALGVQRCWFDDVGGFDEEFVKRGGQDVDFSWKVQRAGGDFAFVPEAVVHYRTRSDLSSVFRQQYRLGQGQAFLYSRYREHGMARSGALEVLSRWAAIILALPALAISARVRGRWAGTLARRLGRAVGSLQFRVVYS